MSTSDLPPPTVSAASAPDLDWSQVTETVRMLHLAIAQIAMAMQQGEDSIDSLSRAFTAMAGNVDAIAQAASQDDDLAPSAVPRRQILASCAEVQGGMQHAIVAFQFYDRLSQRLDHVTHVLSQLAELVADRARLFNPTEWSCLQQNIRARYSMADEQLMFDILLAGGSVEQALTVVRDKAADADVTEIELF